MSVLKNRESAADATQQTFVKVWRNAGKFDTDREFGPWIYAIARRTAIDLLRSEKRREMVTISGEVEVIELSAGIEGAWDAFEVRRAVDQLPDKERIVMRLMHLEGFTQSQAAEELGVAVGTIKSRSHRAHRRLASVLKHLIEE
jgi:RNA polymerase sigma-70 factor (ECF subfamily)